MRSPLGIDSLALAVPRGHLDLRDLAEARGVPASKYLDGIGTQRMAIAAADEDPVTLAASAARRAFALSGRDPGEIGLCVVGTETAVDHSKPIAAFLHGLLGLPSACRVFETKHACFGGTAGLFNALDWIGSGSARGRSALVICADVARYALGSPGEPTQGAGAVAMIVSERPRLLELDAGRSGAYARDVHDFWRPLHSKDAAVDGRLSVQCYLDALAGAYGEWRRIEIESESESEIESGEAGPEEPLARTCYHVPYGKMARKAHRHRRMIDGLDEASADATFAAEVATSLLLPAQIGNVYTGSLYVALASLLHAEARAIEGRRVGLFSYGSGCVAEFFAGRVAAGAADLVARLDLDAPLRASKRLSMAEYEEIRRADADADRRAAPQAAPLHLGAVEAPVAFLGVDGEQRRIYGLTPAA